jgi:multidrug efflux pump
MTSSSTLGSTSITLQFDLNRNIDAAARDVQAASTPRAGNCRPTCPPIPTYRKVNPADAPILSSGADLRHPDHRGQMYDAASTILQQKLSQVQGVGQVFVGGGSLPAVRVDVNPDVAERFRLGLEDVRAALATRQCQSPQRRDCPKGAPGS